LVWAAVDMSDRATTNLRNGNRSSGERLPELLAPAGDWECARAAVENGADGIYFGLERFNARMRAHNFTLADLPELMGFLHRRGVKGYVTFNTLVFAEEMKAAADFLRIIISAGADAVIVQDVGMARLIRALSPDFPIHASTQMTITSAEGVRFAGRLGCQRVILARECSLRDIERIQRELRQPVDAVEGTASNPELEVFVHGALCVAYSGQCLTSESLGGRSANRGECAQACRLPFTLIRDGEPVPLGDRRYLLSPQDLSSVELLPELVAVGVASIKIEGRLKSPEYVAAITGVYRRALDRLGGRSGQGAPAANDPDSRYTMEMAFSRGLHTGWLRGINNQQLVHGRFGKKRGVYLGRVTRVDGGRVWVRLEAPVKPGDGVVFDAGRPQEDEQGGRIYQVGTPCQSASERPETPLSFGRNDLELRKIQPGDRVWKTSDPELERRIRKTFAQGAAPFQRPIALLVVGEAGKPLRIEASDHLGHFAQVESAMPLAVAEKQPLTRERIREHLGRLGGTPYRLESVACRFDGPVMLPVSELNRLRRDLVTKLDTLRSQTPSWTLRTELAFEPPEVERRSSRTVGMDAGSAPEARSKDEPELVVLVRNMTQLEAALDAGCTTLYCEFEDPRRYREAVQRFREWCSHPRALPEGGASPSIWAAPPRIFKDGEEWMLRQIRSAAADGYLVRNPDHIRFFANERRLGDFSLNVANPLAAEHFVRHCGLERVTVSYDLNADQVARLLEAALPDWFEITLHQHMPMFHMEHCVFCAFLSTGTDYTNCGRPCEKHQVALQDRLGVRHTVLADAGCRNTVFNALAQTGAESAARFLALGARRFRIEFLKEHPSEVRRTIAMYRRLLRGELSGGQLWRDLKLVSRLGVTRGQFEKADPAAPRFEEVEW